MILNTENKIESTLKLPYDLIDINTGNERFIFRFKAFDDNRSAHSIQKSGITGRFNVIYQSRGMDCDFECDVTVGNVYAFFISLDSAYDIMSGRNAVASLEGSGRTELTVRYDNKGYCFTKGHFRNKENRYQSGISFSFETDPSYIAAAVFSMNDFFNELIRIQGHSNFY